jgi:AcrR family transcriptional regulator
VYAYFNSKSAIYDAMFGQPAEEFAGWMAEPVHTGDPVADLTVDARRFVEFCTADIPRYQLLFQHTIRGFSPSPESYEPAIRALERTRQMLRSSGVSEPRYLDLWTALTTGLVDQQIANDPGGTRWSRLIDDAVRMFIGYCHDHELGDVDQRPASSEPV